MLSLSTAISALRANQVALNVIGNNVANANTPDFHRQDVRLVDRPPVEINGLHIGQGVDVSHIHRAYDAVTEAALTRNIAERSSIETRLKVSRELESLFTPGQGTILERLESLFNELERLTADPDNTATRAIVVRSAQNLADEINRVSQQLQGIVADLDRAIDNQLGLIEDKSAEIVRLNQKILEAEMKRQSPNDLLDQRDRLVNEVAELIDIRMETQKGLDPEVQASETLFRLADGQLNFLRAPIKLQAYTDAQGQRRIIRHGSMSPLDITQGKLGGLLTARNELLASYQEKLEAFTSGVVQAFDTIHSTGLSVEGSFDFLVGQRYLKETDVPLAAVDTIIPIETGSLYIHVIDPAGQRTVHELQIDAQTDSLMDVAAKISTIDHLQARVDDPPGQLSILAETGYQFDFSNSQPTQLDMSLMTGSSQATADGEYGGAQNDQLTFTFETSGTIGVTPNLLLTARNSSGQLVQQLDVGQGYSPGSETSLGNGVRLRLSAGDANSGDQFSIQLIQQSDSSHLLAALGLNTLFVGQDASTLAVRADLGRNPDKLAATRSGQPLDSRNAEAMVAMRYVQFMDNGTATLEEHFTDIVGSIGAEVQDLAHTEDALGVIGESLKAARAGLSGVDPNEEAVLMLQFQRAFQSAARYIVTVDETLEELINMVR